MTSYASPSELQAYHLPCYWVVKIEIIFLRSGFHPWGKHLVWDRCAITQDLWFCLESTGTDALAQSWSALGCSEWHGVQFKLCPSHYQNSHTGLLCSGASHATPTAKSRGHLLLTLSCSVYNEDLLSAQPPSYALSPRPSGHPPAAPTWATASSLVWEDRRQLLPLKLTTPSSQALTFSAEAFSHYSGFLDWGQSLTLY